MKGLLYKDVSIMTRSFKGNILLLVALYGVLILVTKEAYLAYAMTAVWGIYVASFTIIKALLFSATLPIFGISPFHHVASLPVHYYNLPAGIAMSSFRPV